MIHFHIDFLGPALLRDAVIATPSRPSLQEVGQGQAVPPLLPTLHTVHDVLVCVRHGRSMAATVPNNTNEVVT